jgi:hypothetical protein
MGKGRTGTVYASGILQASRVPSAKYKMLGLIDSAGGNLQAKAGSLSALKVTGMRRGGDVASTPPRLLCSAVPVDGSHGS